MLMMDSRPTKAVSHRVRQRRAAAMMQSNNVLLLLPFVLSTLALSAAKTVYVSQDGAAPNSITFYQAVLNPQASNIVLTSNYSLGDDFSQYKTAPFQLTRNVTVSAVHGVDHVLDLQFMRAKVELCATCAWKWSNLTVANERRGAGPAWDFFVGPEGGQALVISDIMVRWRWACPASKYTQETVRSNQRPPNVPENAARMQEYAIMPVKYHGSLYPDTLVLYDHGAMIPRTVQEGRGVTGGYGLWDRNVTRICYYIVGDDCLQVRPPEACVNDAIDEALAGGIPAARGGISSNHLAVAIAVPIVTAAAVIAVAAALYRHRQYEKQGRRKQYTLKGKQSQELPYANGDGQNWQKPDKPGTGSHDSTQSHTSGPMATRRGWELTSSLTSPQVGPVEDGRITFGDLLGAGSFGRVYRGTWGGRTVAIKVIEYDITTREEVQNEVQLILSFDHPNIVRAYHCVTYTSTGATSGSGKRVSDCSRHGGMNCKAAVGNVGAQNPSNTGDDTLPRHQAGPGGGIVQLHQQAQQRQQAQQHNGHELEAQEAGDQETWTIDGKAPGQETRNQEFWTVAEQAKKDVRQGQALGAITAPSRVETWLVQEYCDCGTLGTFCNRLRESGTASGMTKLVMLLFDVANGLKVLHSRSTVHGDLNARNVLVASNPSAPNGCTAKLADLGLARVMAKARTHRTTDTVGTMSHMPPELLRYGKQSPAGDIYAFGIMMWEVFTGAQAFKDLHYGQFFEEIVLNNTRPPLPPGMPSEYLLLMDHCWAADPADRPTVDRLVQCTEFMVKERQRSTSSSRRSSAVLSEVPPTVTTAGTSTTS